MLDITFTVYLIWVTYNLIFWKYSICANDIVLKKKQVCVVLYVLLVDHVWMDVLLKLVANLWKMSLGKATMTLLLFLSCNALNCIASHELILKMIFVPAYIYICEMIMLNKVLWIFPCSKHFVIVICYILRIKLKN